MKSSEQESLRQAVRDRYGATARAATAGEGTDCCAPSSSGGCCAPVPIQSALLGYSAAETAAVPEGADLGLGCGNPQAIAALKPGGRLAISDIVATAELPDDLRSDLSLYRGCMAGAARIDALEHLLRGA